MIVSVAKEKSGYKANVICFPVIRNHSYKLNCNVVDILQIFKNTIKMLLKCHKNEVNMASVLLRVWTMQKERLVSL